MVVNANALRRKHSPESGSNFVNGSMRDNTLEGVYKWCADFVNGKGLKAPEVTTKHTLEGCIKRMQDKEWWLKKLRVLIKQKTEEVMIHLGKVSRIKDIYCSDLTVMNRQYQNSNN